MAKLYVEIGAKVGELQKALNRIEKQVSRFSYKMERLGTNLTQAITLPLVGLGAASVSTFAQFDKLEKGLGAIAGSADEGKRQLNDLLEVVKDVRTTIDLKDAATGSLQLQAVGISADRAKESLRQLAIAATVSGGSSDDVAEVARQLAQAAAKGNILQQELRIILERIPALAGVIKNEFGTVTAEGLRDAGVSADEFISRLTKAIAENEKFANVQASLSKEIETFKINLQLAAKELGQSIANAINLQENLRKLSGFISGVIEGFKSLTPEVQSFIVKAALLVAAIGPILLIIGKLSSIIPILILGVQNVIGVFTAMRAVLLALLSSTGLLIGTLVAIGAALAYVYTQSADVRKIINGVINVIIELGNIAGDVVANLAKGFAALADFRFEDAFDSFNKALTNINPIAGLAEGQGGRLGKAFREGFEDETNRIDAGIEAIKKKIFRATTEAVPAAQTSGAAITPDLSGLGVGAGAGEKVAQNYVLPINDAIRKLIRENPLPRLFTDTEAAADSLFRRTSNLQDALIKPSALALINEELKKIDITARVLGQDSFSSLTEKVNFLKNEVAELAVKWGENSVQVQGLRETLAPLEEELLRITRQKESFEAISGIINDVAAGFDGWFTTLLEGGKDAFKSFRDSLKKLLVDLAKAVVVAATLALVFSALGGGGFLALFKTAGIGGGGFLSNILKLIPGNAEGGIVPPGYPNDSYLSRLSSQEAIIPLNKLDRYMGGATEVTGQFRISGNDLVATVERNVLNRERTRGK